MAGLPVANQTCTNDIPGIPGELVGPMVTFISITPTVLAEGKPVLTLGATIPMHGNPFNSLEPGWNPACAASAIALKTIPRILVQGKPIAVAGSGVGSAAACTHYVNGPGALTVLASP